MKGITISLAIVVIGLLLFQANQIHSLQSKVEALHATQRQATSDAAEVGSRVLY